jgi:anti-sigma factor RsiW
MKKDLLRATGDHPDGGEPDFDTLAACVDGSLSETERLTVVEHLGRCERCRIIVAELTRARPAARATPGWTVALPLAASLALAVAGGGLYWAVRDQPVQQAAQPPAPTVSRANLPTPGDTAPATEPSRPVSPPAVSPPRPPDRTRAAGARSLSGRSFRLVAGEWIDVEYRLVDGLPVEDVRTREDLDARDVLRPFAALGTRFTVVLNGRVYRVAIPPK